MRLHSDLMLELLKQTVKEYGEDDVPIRAAALAYFSVFSIAPLLVLLIAVLVFVGAGDAQGTVLGLVEEAVGEDAAEAVAGMIETQQEQGMGGGIIATVIGIVVLLFAATTLFHQLKNALNHIWGVAPETSSALGGVMQLVKARLMSLGLILGIGALLLLALIGTTIVGAVVNAIGDDLPGGPGLWLMLNYIVGFAVLVGVFLLVFMLLPNAEVPWQPGLIGAVVTAVLFVIGTVLFGIYISNVAVADTFGAAGSLVVLLLWVYFSSQIVLFGGEFTQVLARRRYDAITRAAG
jgi:membrane protein